MTPNIPEKGPVTNSDITPLLPVEARKKVLPTIISRLILGARVMSPWHGRTDIAVVEDVYGSTTLSLPDFAIAKEVAERIAKELDLKRVVPAHQILVIRDRAQEILESMVDERAGKYGVIMLKDQGGCGYWRMALPSRYIDRTGLYVDVTGGAVDFDHLLEYDTICVQRVSNWDSVSVLERMKKVGKRIIYDIDDDLFDIPDDNPAAKGFGRSEQMAAVECMKLADAVTVTTVPLQERLTRLIGKAPVVVPNSIDVDAGWQPTPLTGSPDGWKRIFWQGSNTHDEDWEECFQAVCRVMQKRRDVRLVVLGFLPTLVKKDMAHGQHWTSRIEYLGPMDPEAYFRLIKNVRAEVGLAPLRANDFNMAKSSIKWIENTMIGMPTIASDVRAYSDVITHGEDGFICSTEGDWMDCIELCLDDERARKTMIEKARRKVRNEFNIKNTVKTWRRLLIGDYPGADV